MLFIAGVLCTGLILGGGLRGQNLPECIRATTLEEQQPQMGGGLPGQNLSECMLPPSGPCTFETCWDLSRCDPANLTFYMYPGLSDAELMRLMYYISRDHPVDDTLLWGVTFQSEFEILYELRKRPERVDDPEKACFLVPPSSAQALAWTKQWLQSDKLQRFPTLKAVPNTARPYWNGGKNHVIREYFAESGTNVAFEGNSLHWKGFFKKGQYRQGFDVSDTCHPYWGGSNAESFVYSHDYRPLLANFFGTAHHHQSTRQPIIEMSDGLDLVAKESQLPALQERLGIDNPVLTKTCFHGLAEITKFCLAPRGTGVCTRRTVDSLTNGCVPVVIADEWELPFNDGLLDWTRFSVLWPETNDIKLLIPALKEMVANKTYDRLQSQIPEALVYLKSGRHRVDAFIELMRLRLQDVQVRCARRKAN